jgi:DNA polymerase III epsilon subunit-like protein
VRSNTRRPEAAKPLAGVRASGSSRGQTAVIERAAHFAVVDVETTGLDPAGTRMVEIAIVEMDQSGRLVDEFSTLLSIPGEGPLGAEFIHRISRPMLATAPRFEDVARTICERLSGRIIVGHVVAFDIGHLDGEFARAGLSMPSLLDSTLCTRELARVVLPPGPKTLASCCEATGIEHRAAHTALGDARATAELLVILLRSGFDAGLETLSAAARRVSWPDLDYLDRAKHSSRFVQWLRARGILSRRRALARLQPDAARLPSPRLGR